jgi:hypothetical protein
MADAIGYSNRDEGVESHWSPPGTRNARWLLDDPFFVCRPNVLLQPRRHMIAPAAVGCKRLILIQDFPCYLLIASRLAQGWRSTPRA